MAVERFERGRAAAYEPGVYLENPIGMSKHCENRTGYQKKKKGDLHPKEDFPSIPCPVRRVELVS